MSTAIGGTAAELARTIRSRECSAFELVQGLLDRIERRKPALNAIVTLDGEGALDRMLTQRFDAFLCPAVITNAFAHSAPRMPFMVDGESVDSRFADHYLLPFNLLGTPAVVLPAGLAADGLPVGVQLVGARWRDEELLATARAVESVIGGFRPAPDPLN